jgi:hypothetical protein
MHHTTAHNGSSFEAEALAHLVNAAYRAGSAVEINGREVKAPSWTARPAEVWANGSVSVDVAPRTRGAHSGHVWVKRGQSATVVVTPREAQA